MPSDEPGEPRLLGERRLSTAETENRQLTRLKFSPKCSTRSFNPFDPLVKTWTASTSTSTPDSSNFRNRGPTLSVRLCTNSCGTLGHSRRPPVETPE